MGLTGFDGGTFVQDKIIYTAGSFVNATTGTFPDNYVHTGIAYDAGSTEKACMALFAPVTWETVDVSILALAASFGSGNVVFRLGDEGGDNDVTVAVAGAFVGELAFPTPPQWAAASGPFAGLQFAQFALSRIGGNGADTLAEDLGVLAVVLTKG